MAIEYVINQHCEPKKKVPLNVLIGMIKQRNRALEIFERLIKDGKTEAKNTIFTVQICSVDGQIESQNYKISELFDNTKILDELKQFCTNCPVSCKKAFGCYQFLNYPISAKSEEWLMEVSKNALKKGLPNSLIFDFILEQKINGEHFNKMRNDSRGCFFELKKPLEIGNGLGEKIINTNQIFDAIFGMGLMKAPHMLGLLFFSGCLTVQDQEPTEGTFQQAVQMMAKEGKKHWYIFNLANNATDDHFILMLKDFFQLIFLSFCLNKEISIEI